MHLLDIAHILFSRFPREIFPSLFFPLFRNSFWISHSSSFHFLPQAYLTFHLPRAHFT